MDEHWACRYAADVWWGEKGFSESSLTGEAEAYGSEYAFHSLDNVIVTPHYGGGIGLDGIEEERANAVVETIIGALDGTLLPCDLSKGY